MKDRSSIGVGHHYEIGALADVGGNPIELHLLFVPECELTGGRPRSRGHRGEKAPIAFLPIRGSSATQLFSKKITNKGMSVQFPRVVRVFPARSLALFNRERSVRYSAGLNAVKDSVRPWDGQRIQQRSKRLIVSEAKVARNTPRSRCSSTQHSRSSDLSTTLCASLIASRASEVQSARYKASAFILR